MTDDRRRLLRILKRAARPSGRRAIVCYDAKWAGLPRVTVYDRPKRKRPRRSYIGSRISVRPVRVAAYVPQSCQLELAL